MDKEEILVAMIKTRIDMIKPHIVLGDEDSMELRPFQIGQREALEWVLQRIKEL